MKNKAIHFRVSEEEKKEIEEQMKKKNCRSLSEYILSLVRHDKKTNHVLLNKTQVLEKFNTLEEKIDQLSNKKTDYLIEKILDDSGKIKRGILSLGVHDKETILSKFKEYFPEFLTKSKI